MDFIIEFMFGIVGLGSIITARLGLGDEISKIILEILILMNMCVAAVCVMVILVTLRAPIHLYYIAACLFGLVSLLYKFFNTKWMIAVQFCWIVIGTIYTCVWTGWLLRLKNTVGKLCNSLMTPHDPSKPPCPVHLCVCQDPPISCCPVHRICTCPPTHSPLPPLPAHHTPRPPHASSSTPFMPLSRSPLTMRPPFMP